MTTKHIESVEKAAEKIAESTEACRKSMLGGARHQRFPEADWIATIITQETAAELDRLRKALQSSIASGPMKINPTPETFKSVEILPDTTMLDFRVSVFTYKKIKSALANSEPESVEKEKE